MQPRREGIDPLIDESILIEALDVTISSETIQQIQSGAFLLVLDAWDRKVTRDQFIAALGAAQALIDSVARVSLMSNVKRHQARSGAVTPADIESAVHGCMEMAKDSNRECLKMAQLLKQCATKEDPIH